MVKDLSGDIVIDIMLINGESFLCCDITSRPVGDDTRTISCWHESKVKCFPMSQVAWFAFYERPTA